jgi:NAD(P)-dependent dehydrogenase (short-subunit alcohol dehydrogenase family)
MPPPRPLWAISQTLYPLHHIITSHGVLIYIAGLDFSEGKLSSQVPLGRVGTPEEVADAALFLATNSYANNCVLNIDGGLSAADQGLASRGGS